MVRTPPVPCPSFAVIRRRPDPLLEVEIAVVTPMFGGGATPREPDPLLPVRGSSVRGHLRFWWRACNAHRCASVDELFRREAEIWGTAGTGGTGGPSAIDVAVEMLSPRPVELSMNEWQGRYPPYAVWPFGEDRQRSGATALEGVRFRLRLSAATHIDLGVPAERDRLVLAAEAALWAWITFGGVGARTRRGCGSLWCDDQRFNPGTAAGLAERLSQRAAHYAPENALSDSPDVPFLPGGRVLLKRSPAAAVNPLAAWAEAIEVMRVFRQGINVGRNPGPGQSRWPEADSIRNLTGTTVGRLAPSDPNLRYFPRAEFGLPIVFHFKQDPAPHPDGMDPPSHILETTLPQAKRMASPVILKPLMISATTARPMVALLDAPMVADRRDSNGHLPLSLRPLDGGTRMSLDDPSDVFDPAKAAAVQPIVATGETNARAAFLAFVRQRWGPQLEEAKL